MTVTVDAATEHVRTDTTSPQAFSHVGASSGVKGAILAIVYASNTDHVSAASYGGVAMTRIVRFSEAGAEPGSAELWFLGASVPQGTNDFSYTPGSTTDDIHAVGITLLAATDTESIDNDGISSTALANPSVTLNYAGRSAMAFAALFDAENSLIDVFTENANCTRIHSHNSISASAFSCVFRQTTAGTADFAIGGTCASDEVAMAAMAIAEVVAAGQPTSRRHETVPFMGHGRRIGLVR